MNSDIIRFDSKLRKGDVTLTKIIVPCSESFLDLLIEEINEPN